MLKKLFLLVALLGATAFIVLFGDDLDIFTPVGVTETAVPTQTEVVIVTTEVTATSQPTQTPQPTETVPATETSQATATIEFTPTIPATATIAPTVTQSYAEDLFEIQEGSPVFLSNFVHTAEGCNWNGIAGQIFGSTGLPLTDYIVRLEGTYNGMVIDQVGVTGIVANNPYGPGSFEFVLGSVALDTQDQLTIQVFDPIGVEVTSPRPLDTSSQCSQNLQIINFIQK